MSSAKANIVLIGYRGCGKTTVGRILARRLGRPFVDTDDRIETRAGRTIQQIFAAEGEAEFRRMEREAICDALSLDQGVIAVGGGAVMDPANARLLAERATVVWLEADIEILWRRIQTDPNSASRRPNLTTGGIEEVQALLAVREPAYSRSANLTLDASNATPAELAETICFRLGLSI